jgi:sensor histidine kinase regulating citrate/malate metabolism
MLDSVHSLYSRSPWAEGKNILIDVLGTDFTVESDHTMLVRCVGNLVKNALEASVHGQDIVLTASGDCAFGVIKVKNECVMSEDVRLQVFQRSFSTKAASGRGLGTYGVKLLVEQYLCGKVEFESEEGMGTVFTLNIPRVFTGRVS